MSFIALFNKKNDFVFMLLYLSTIPAFNN